jgi:hypothetical protein
MKLAKDLNPPPDRDYRFDRLLDQTRALAEVAQAMTLNSNPYGGPTGELDDLTAREGLVKFDRDTPLEQFLFGTGCLGILAAIVMLQIGTIGGRHSKPQPAVLPYIPLAVLIAAVFFAARYFTDNYYLVDPKQHLVYYHFKFLWFRTVRLLLRREDILAVATRGRARSSRSSTWWEYQVVLIGANGHGVPVRNWEREAIDECNAEAERLGTLLGCPSHKSPRSCQLRYEITNGSVSINFEPLPWWGFTLPIGVWVALAGVVLAVGFMTLRSLRM